MTFTDDDLDPRRTTRGYAGDPSHPVLDAKDSLARGDLLLVVTTPYSGRPDPEWCVFEYASPGSASVYPYKVRIPGLGIGQYRASEIRAWARPVELHSELAFIRREMPT